MAYDKVTEGAVAFKDYCRSSGTTRPKLKTYTSSTIGERLMIPKEDRRPVKEQVVQSEIIAYLRSRGAWCTKQKAVNLVGDGVLAPTDLGVPDILACYKGRFIGIEVKAPRTPVKVSGEQIAQGKAIQRSGGYWLLAWKLEQVVALLDSIDKST